MLIFEALLKTRRFLARQLVTQPIPDALCQQRGCHSPTYKSMNRKMILKWLLRYKSTWRCFKSVCRAALEEKVPYIADQWAWWESLAAECATTSPTVRFSSPSRCCCPCATPKNRHIHSQRTLSLPICHSWSTNELQTFPWQFALTQLGHHHHRCCYALKVCGKWCWNVWQSVFNSSISSCVSTVSIHPLLRSFYFVFLDNVLL